MTLENAVRALAGTFILVSLALGQFAHPAAGPTRYPIQ